ncbi:MAG: PGN_0703 family putative restriction endonuclease [Mesorhizobium sp.]
MTMPSRPDFVAEQRAAQAAFLAAALPGHVGYEGSAWRLPPQQRLLNLNPVIRDAAERYFADNAIAWHQHAAHGLSSQVACLNALMPLATRPDVLARLVQSAVGGELPEMLPVEAGPDGEPWFVGFEWIGRVDHLNEWPRAGQPRRGASVTSADAILRFRQSGRVETLLVEWKYTESYGAPPEQKREAERLRRYQKLIFAPFGPLRSDAGLKPADLFWEPFYQLMRQQILAARMQAAREDGAERVRVLHVAPAGNWRLRRVTSPALRGLGDDAFTVFGGLLADPESFVSRSAEALFGPLLDEAPADDAWAGYLRARYALATPPCAIDENGSR